MGRIYKTDRSPGIRINRLFKYSLLFSLIIGFFVPVSAFWGNAAPSAPPSLPPAFSIATTDKRTDSPVQWVAGGGGILAYGAGQHVDFALEGDPFTTVSHLTFNGTISEALILGKYAFLSQEELGLRMIDLSVPSNPLDLGYYPLFGTAFHLASWGNLLFVAGVNPGIQIFEISFSGGQNPPINLIPREVIPVGDPIMALAASEWNLYAGTGKEIKVYDVSDPSFILETESLPVTLPVRSMAINGESLYVAAGAEGLHVVDLSVPGNTGLLATHPVQSESLYLAGRLIYLATGSDGLHLLKAGPIGAATFNVQVAPGGRVVFSPEIVNVNTGDTVNWTWGGNAHSSTSGPICPNFDGPGPNSWDSGVHNPPFSFPFTFNSPGSFPYFCSVHCFTGTVLLQAQVRSSISPSPRYL